MNPKCQQTLELPPMEANEIPLSEALLRRESCRDFQGPGLSVQDIANVIKPTIVRSRKPFLDDESRARFRFGTYPSGGGLYPVEHYLILTNITGRVGEIHYIEPETGDLVLVNKADRSNIERAFSAREGWVHTAGFVVVQTSIFERTCIKYGNRGYRLAMLEAGHASQNLLLQSAAVGLGSVAWAGFYDDLLADLLKLDRHTEPVISTIFVGRPSK